MLNVPFQHRFCCRPNSLLASAGRPVYNYKKAALPRDDVLSGSQHPTVSPGATSRRPWRTKSVRIGVDVGETFTDIVCFYAQEGDFRLLKVPSTSNRPSAAVIKGTRWELS